MSVSGRARPRRIRAAGPIGPGPRRCGSRAGHANGHGPMAPEWVTSHPSRPRTGHCTAPQSRSCNGRGPGTPGPGRKGTVAPHPSQAPSSRGPAAPESIAPQSWSRRFRVSVGLITVAVQSHLGRARDGRGPGASESVAQTVAGAGVIRVVPARAWRTAKPRTTRLR